MSGSSPTLLREWGFLQSYVMPSLLKVDQRRSARAWSIGSVEDAIAVAVAFRYARGPASTEGFEAYAGPARSDGWDARFALSDLRCVPAESQSAYFVRQDRKWVVDDEIAEHVVLEDPVDPVDLVTLRSAVRDGDRSIDAALDQLAPGGQLLLIGSNDAPPRFPEELEPHDRTSDGVVYLKSASGGSQQKAEALTRADPPETLIRRRAQEQLVRNHVRLARSLARRFAHRGEPVDDLEQVAMLALVKASRRFDPGRDTRFATYATSSILGELKRHFRDKSWMLRVPRPVQELYLSVKQVRTELTQTLGASPTPGQIADHLQVSEAAVLEAIGAGDNLCPASLDGRTRDDPAIEIPVLDESLDRSLDRVQVQRLLPRLDDSEQLVLKRIYFDNCTQRDVAAELRVSQMQVSRLLARALAKLRA